MEIKPNQTTKALDAFEMAARAELTHQLGSARIADIEAWLAKARREVPAILDAVSRKEP